MNKLFVYYTKYNNVGIKLLLSLSDKILFFPHNSSVEIPKEYEFNFLFQNRLPYLWI